MPKPTPPHDLHACSAVGQSAARSASPASDGAAASFNATAKGSPLRAEAKGPPTPSPAKRTQGLTRPRQPRARALFPAQSCDDGLLAQPASQDSADPEDGDWMASEDEYEEEEATYIRKSRRNSRSLHRRVASVPGAMQLADEGGTLACWLQCLCVSLISYAVS